MTTIDYATGWFEFLKILTYALDEVMGCNDEYIDKSSARISQLFNNTWLIRQPRQHKVVFDNVLEFK